MTNREQYGQERYKRFHIRRVCDRKFLKMALLQRKDLDLPNSCKLEFDVDTRYGCVYIASNVVVSTPYQHRRQPLHPQYTRDQSQMRVLFTVTTIVRRLIVCIEISRESSYIHAKLLKEWNT